MNSIVWLLALCSVVSSADRRFINFGGFSCPREERALGRCLRDALNTYIPQLADGLPEYNIPPSEPLVVPSITVQQAEGPVSVTSIYSDVTVRGPSLMRIKDVQVISKENKVVAQLFIPELRMKGHYKLDGQLLVLPIEGEGEFTAVYGDIKAVVTIILGRLHRPNEADAVECKDLDVKFQVGTAAMELENLFGGDAELGHAMNRFLNDHWQTLTSELQTPMEEALRDFLKPLADHAFATLHADDVLSS